MDNLNTSRKIVQKVDQVWLIVRVQRCHCRPIFFSYHDITYILWKEYVYHSSLFSCFSRKFGESHNQDNFALISFLKYIYTKRRSGSKLFIVTLSFSVVWLKEFWLKMGASLNIYSMSTVPTLKNVAILAGTQVLTWSLACYWCKVWKNLCWWLSDS